jgi:predicted O-methyltransferase YrrM
MVADMSGNLVPFSNGFDADEAQYIYGTVRGVKPEKVLECGFEHGSSTICILQALHDNNFGSLYTIDPLQDSHYHGVGVANVKALNLQGRFQYICAPDQFVLPQLAISGYVCEFAFIDSNHMFDQTIVESFFIDKMLRVGGYMLFDDYSLSSVKSACSFVEANLPYQVVDCPFSRFRLLRKLDIDRREWFYFKPFEVAQEDQVTPRLKKSTVN